MTVATLHLSSAINGDVMQQFPEMRRRALHAKGGQCIIADTRL